MVLQSSSAVLSSLSFLLLTIGPPLSVAQFEGESCTVDDSPGVCTHIEQCPPVHQALLSGIYPRKLCGYVKFEPIICCPSNKPRPKPRPTTTTTTTTTAAPVTTFVIDNRINTAREKCAEYSKAVFELVDPPTLAANRKPQNTSVCAITTRKLIVGGMKAEAREYPHMAAVGFNNDEGGITWSCGGTLISERFVLTAAHCTYHRDFGQAAVVRVGDLNLVRTDDDAKPQDIPIIKRIRHPLYKRPAEYHDIALLQLKTNVVFNKWVRPCCLPYSLPDTGIDNNATATGWGHVEWAGDTSNDLLKVTLKLIPQEKCNDSYATSQDYKLPRGIVADWQLCAGSSGKDTCQGDSGGPLVVLNNDYYCMYSLIGITSTGKDCGGAAPGIYTRVYNYISWIESIVWPES